MFYVSSSAGAGTVKMIFLKHYLQTLSTFPPVGRPLSGSKCSTLLTDCTHQITDCKSGCCSEKSLFIFISSVQFFCAFMLSGEADPFEVCIWLVVSPNRAFCFLCLHFSPYAGKEPTIFFKALGMNDLHCCSYALIFNNFIVKRSFLKNILC